MTTIAIVGDLTTTTAVALAASWPSTERRDVVVIEGDPRGGSLAAWFDVPLIPSLSSVVTALHRTENDGVVPWPEVRSFVRRVPAGLDVLPAPFRCREAATAVAQAERLLWPACTSADAAVVIVDAGRLDGVRPPGIVTIADFVLVVHRQHDASVPAATVRLERLAEDFDTITGRRAHAPDGAGLLLVGDDPFGLAEVADFAAPDLPSWRLAVDPLAAAVLAGRPGVSARRLARLPLLRTAAAVADDLADLDERAVDADHASTTDPATARPCGDESTIVGGQGRAPATALVPGSDVS